MSTLLLSGWAQPADALSHLTPDGVLFDYSLYPGIGAAVDALRAVKAERVIGWSTGGHLALQAIAAGAVKVKHVTLIASPHQFVGDVGVKGMDPLTFQLFRESYASDPARTKARFHALVAKGDSGAKQVMEQLRHHAEVENTSRWLPWLDALAASKLSITARASAPPTLIIHGMNDAIVPYAQGEFLAANLPNTQLNGWAGIGHAPHVHDAARVMREIAEHRTRHGVA